MSLLDCLRREPRLRLAVRRARDLWEDRSRRGAVPPADRPDLGLSGLQMYPAGDSFHESLTAAAATHLAGLDYRPGDPVGAIGSCFAEEFAVHMGATGAAYQVVEPNHWGFTADWGRVYTPVALEQIVRYSFDESTPVVLAQGKDGWFDPLREHGVDVLGDDRARAVARVVEHRAASRKAFQSVSVLALTLGQLESWFDRELGIHWASHPKRLGSPVDRDRFEPTVLTFNDVVASLRTSIGGLLGANPGLRIVLTVSPVPAHAVFTAPAAITASMANKCLLRAAADVVCREHADRVFYFPSFEAVLAHNPGSYRPDNRHVKRVVIGRIFAMLDAGFATSGRTMGVDR